MKPLVISCLLAFIFVLVHESCSFNSRSRNLRPSGKWRRTRFQIPQPWRQIPTPRKRPSSSKSKTRKTTPTPKPDFKEINPAKSPEDGSVESPKKTKKSDYYIDPALFAKMQKVKSMEDFVRVFKPPGYTIKKEMVFVSGTDKDLTAPAGRKPDGGFEQLGGIKPAPTAVEKDVIYFNSRKVSDEVVKDSTPLGCGLKLRNKAIPARSGAIHFPTCINLKKCSGCCGISMECVATKTINKTQQVFYIGQAGMNQVPVPFTEDAACACSCIVKQSDCLPTQTYSASRCQCECNRTPTPCPTGKIWERKECGCVCSNRRVCKSRTRKWDEKSCRCNCISDPCPKGQTRNKENCRCVGSTSFDSFSAQSLKDKTTQSRSPGRSLSSIDDIFSNDDDDDDDDQRDDDYEEDWK